MKLKDLLIEKKVEHEIDIDIDFDVVFYDEDTNKDIDTINGSGKIVGIWEFGSSSSYSSDRHGDDSWDDLEENYDDAEFELSAETEKQIAAWNKKVNFKEYKIIDRDYTEMDLKKHKVELTIMVSKKK